MSDIAELQQRALEIKSKYDAYNARNGDKKWDARDYASGFVGDVGDLLKIIMALDGKRHIDAPDTKLAHELSDCLWSLLVLSNEYGVDLDVRFKQTMEQLEERLAA